MLRFTLTSALSLVLAAPLPGQDVDSLVGKRLVFPGDSIAQAGEYSANSLRVVAATELAGSNGSSNKSFRQTAAAILVPESSRSLSEAAH